MKVERTFKPLVLVIETEEELKALWHLANCGEGTALLNYCKENEADKEKVPAVKSELFGILDVEKEWIER